ncbi:hypothetical protein TTY48_26240 [Tsukamurella sp. TY48]|nr:hypothetical protein TTY48_26240 [Tsukamurella sp. TY48]
MAGSCRIVHSVVQVAPGAIGWCGPPSLFAGRCMPCQCTVVSSGRVLRTRTRTFSPSRARSVGPSTAPLKPQVRVARPGVSSAVPACAVSSNSRAPSASVRDGASGGTGRRRRPSGPVPSLAEDDGKRTNEHAPASAGAATSAVSRERRVTVRPAAVVISFMHPSSDFRGP